MKSVIDNHMKLCPLFKHFNAVQIFCCVGSRSSKVSPSAKKYILFFFIFLNEQTSSKLWVILQDRQTYWAHVRAKKQIYLLAHIFSDLKTDRAEISCILLTGGKIRISNEPNFLLKKCFSFLHCDCSRSNEIIQSGYLKGLRLYAFPWMFWEAISP